MAIIIEKNERRCRVQFSMPRQLYEAHQRNLDLAKELGAAIDFNRDFERWFHPQVEQVAKELERLKQERANIEPKTVTQKTKVPSTVVAQQVEVPDGND